MTSLTARPVPYSPPPALNPIHHLGRPLTLTPPPIPGPSAGDLQLPELGEQIRSRSFHSAQLRAVQRGRDPAFGETSDSR